MTDKKHAIISILQQNARISDTALGEVLGMTAEEAAAEIRKLEEEGIIKGYSVILDEELYDKSLVYATIELKVTPQRDCGFDDIAKTLMDIPHEKQGFRSGMAGFFANMIRGRYN